MKRICTLPIAGMHYRKLTKEQVEAITPWTEVTLKRERDNKYDPRAVAVYCGDLHIGYIPMKYNKSIANLMDTNEDIFQAKVADLQPEFGEAKYVSLYVTDLIAAQLELAESA